MSELADQMHAHILAILVEAEIVTPIEEPDGSTTYAQDPDFQWDTTTTWKCVRAAYAHGYQGAFAERPFPLTVASAHEREAWARLPL